VFLQLNILVPRVDEICSSNAIFLFLHKRDVFLWAIFFVPRVGKMCSSDHNFGSQSKWDLFLVWNNFVPWVDKMSSSEALFLFRGIYIFSAFTHVFVQFVPSYSTSVLKYKTFYVAQIVYQNVLYFIIPWKFKLFCTSFFISLVVVIFYSITCIYS
jgi:hypothetical protein